MVDSYLSTKSSVYGGKRYRAGRDKFDIGSLKILKSGKFTDVNLDVQTSRNGWGLYGFVP